MKIFFYVLLILLSYINTFGQSPDWTVDESKYLHSMTFVMSANYNGTPLSNSNDKVAAFVGGEIRGSSKLYYVSRADRYLAYVTVRANTINETVTFKFYDSVNDQVVNASRTVLFEIDRHYGDSFQTFCISNPDLSSEANITAFSFSGSETTTTTIAEAKVSIASNVYISDNIDQLNAIFELSTGASLYDNGIPKKKISSGSNSIDFSTSQIVNVLSADETTLKAWTIEIIPTWYIGVDADADGFFGSTTSITQSASPGFGYSTTPPATPDCNDSDAAINPNTVWYIGLDTDGDTFFGSTTSVTQCTSPGDGYLTTLQTTDDCNDSDAAINPNTMWYLGLDADADGFFESITSVKQCTSPGDGYATTIAITITADAKSKVYGEVDPALTYQITSGSFIPGETLTGVLTRAAGENVGSYAIASSLSNANYEITFVPANVTITKAAITITADAKEKVYGEVDPALTYQITNGSLINGDTLTGVLARAAGEDVGSYAIASSLSNANYEITFVPADVTITTRPITITANAGQSKLYGNSDPIYSCAVEASGASRGIVAGDSFTGAVGRASGENVSSSYALNQGTLANSNYAISFVSDNFAITPRAITITANAGQSKLYGNSDPSYSYAVEASGVSRGIVAGDSFTGAVGRAPGENVSSSYALNQGTLANSNYAISFVSDNFAITPRAITITADAKSKFYGEVDPVLTYQITSGALMAGDILSGFLMRAEGEDEGSYAITSSLSNINYEITFVPANVTITKVAQTIDDWNGITNTDWNNAANWSLGSVPLSIHTISIPSGLSNYPIIPTNTDAAVHTITIASGASLTLLKGSTLSVIGNFTETSGTVTLNSDSDEFSSLLVGGSTSGNITYNRYVNIVGNGEWDLIGSPVSGMSFSTFLQNANIARNGSFYAVGYYDNTANTWTNVTSAISGYSQLGYGYQMATTSGGTLAFTGAIANGNQSVKIQNNDAANSGAGTRWNIIANPFASYLYANSNADATSNFLTINTAAIDDNFEAIYGHKADGTGYTIYNNTSSATYIAPGQGFFVAAAGNGEDKTISFTKAMQTITGTDDFIASKTSATSYELVLEMHQDAKKLGDTKFYFKEGLTLGLDPGYDAGAFNQGSALSSRLVDNDQGVGMGINAMSIDHMGSVAVPLVVNQEAGIPFALRIANHTLPSDINVYVEDLVEKTLTLVTAQSFELTPQTKLSGIGRFYLHFTRSSLSLESIANTSLITAYKGIGNDYISIEGLQQFSKASKIILYNLLGMKIIDKTIDTPSQKETITIVGIKEGAYILQINYGNQVLTKKMVID